MTGDATRLQQVMWNLLKNGVKIFPGGRERFAWRPGMRRAGFWYRSRTTGLASSRGRLSLIFDPFHQENLEVTRQFGGLGLGLAIARATVDAHGGSLRAESAGRGAGATFIVDLPLRGGAGAAP